MRQIEKLANPNTGLWCRSEKISPVEFEEAKLKGWVFKYEKERHVIDKNTRRLIAKFSPEFGYCKIIYGNWGIDKCIKS